MTAARTKPPRRRRLDELVTEARLAASLDEARRLIMAGLIRTGDRVWDKAGQLLPADTALTLKESACPFASQGGLKLEAGLAAFGVEVTGFRCLDIGASTGGFTDVLLQRGAAHVTALDVGYGQLAYHLATDERVRVLDRTNLRLLPDAFFPEPFDLIVTDVSFISLRLILPKALAFLRKLDATGVEEPGCRQLSSVGVIIALIKPQFEAPRSVVPPGGIVTDLGLHIRLITELRDAHSPIGLFLQQIQPVQPGGPRKNREYISLWNRAGPGLPDEATRERVNSSV